MLRYFLGDADVDDGATGMHLRLLGEAGLISGSKSMVLFNVAPHAMTSVCKRERRGAKYRNKTTIGDNINYLKKLPTLATVYHETTSQFTFPVNTPKHTAHSRF